MNDEQAQHFIIVSGDGKRIWRYPFPTYEAAAAELQHQIHMAGGKNEVGWHVLTRYHYQKVKKDAFDAM